MYDERNRDPAGTRNGNDGTDKKREFLAMYIENRREIEYIVERIVRLRAQAEKMTASLRETPGSIGFAPGMDSLQNCMGEIMEQEQRYLRRMQQNLQLLGAMEDAIDSLSRPFHRQLLRMRFIDGAEWPVIADTLGYTPRHLQRELEKAILLMVLPGTIERWDTGGMGDGVDPAAGLREIRGESSGE